MIDSKNFEGVSRLLRQVKTATDCGLIEWVIEEERPIYSLLSGWINEDSMGLHLKYIHNTKDTGSFISLYVSEKIVETSSCRSYSTILCADSVNFPEMYVQLKQVFYDIYAQTSAKKSEKVLDTLMQILNKKDIEDKSS